MADVISLPVWLSTKHPCHYLQQQTAQSILLADESIAPDTSIYSALIQQGFRRSGNQIYAPHCPNCQACLASRIAVEDFRANRGQKRCWQLNQNIQFVIREPVFDPRHFALYRRYQLARHTDNLAEITEQNYIDFLRSDWCDTWFVEFSIEGQLVGVAIVDVLVNGLSAVYTFYDPDFDRHSLGTYAVLWQIEQARQRHLAFVYLGYWIEDCRKMRYKKHFQPLQIYKDQRWQIL